MCYHADARKEGRRSAYSSSHLALLKIAGGAWLSLLALEYCSLNRSDKVNEGTLSNPCVGLVASLSSLYAAIYVRQNTPARPPLMVMTAGALLLVAGFLLSLRAAHNVKSKRSARKIVA
jgi:hypothetical protein